MLVDAAHAALEDGEVAFGGVRGDEAVRILAFAVVDREVLAELLAHGRVVRGFVGHERGIAVGVADEDGADFVTLEGCPP
jgi:hypothetical protein